MRASHLALFALIVVGCTGPNPDFESRSPPVDAPVETATQPPVEPPADGGPPANDVAAGIDVVSDQAQEDTNSGGAPDAAAEPMASPLGVACTAGTQCASGFCTDGVCCNIACAGVCFACNLPGSMGTCTATAAGQDPRDQCVAEPASTCGRNGSCDGKGACALHPVGTECVAASCASAMAIPARTCNGAGACNTVTVQTCSSGLCSGDHCAVGCTSSTECPSGQTCVAARCELPGPALHWRLDEMGAGLIAADSSGNGTGGTYTGLGAVPTASADVPPTSFANPSSRLFGATGRPAVVRPDMPTTLRPTGNLTFMIWFKASTVPIGGADLFNCDNDLLLRLKNRSIEFAKRKSMVMGEIYDIAAANDVSRHLDGKWHHLAAVISPTGMHLYLDGLPMASDASTLPILYLGKDCWLGRAGTTTGHDFQGGMDDFRIYLRPVGSTEIAGMRRAGP